MYLGELLKDCTQPGFYPRRKAWPQGQFATFIRHNTEWVGRRWEKITIDHQTMSTMPMAASPGAVKGLGNLLVDDWELTYDAELIPQMPLGYIDVKEAPPRPSEGYVGGGGAPPNALPLVQAQFGMVVYVDVHHYRMRACALRRRDEWQDVRRRRGVIVYAEPTILSVDVYVDGVELSISLSRYILAGAPWPIWIEPEEQPAVLDASEPPVMLGPRSRPIELQPQEPCDVPARNPVVAADSPQ